MNKAKEVYDKLVEATKEISEGHSKLREELLELLGKDDHISASNFRIELYMRLLDGRLIETNALLTSIVATLKSIESNMEK